MQNLNKMEATHQVLDLFYTPDEGQECYDFIQQQGVATFMYKVVPIVRMWRFK